MHFYYAPKTGEIDDGPSLVAFPRNETVVSIDNGARNQGPDYLLFLKARKDGKYDPVSGQVDPSFSARELKDPPNAIVELVRQRPN